MAMASGLSAAEPQPASTAVAWVYDANTTPKARLVGQAAAVAVAAQRLEERLGPPLRLADGLGWNLNRRAFAQAEAWLNQVRAGALGDARRGEHRLLLPWPQPALSVVSQAGRSLTLVGYGKVFRLSRAQAQGQHGALGLEPGAAVRYAYYA